jgi:hypothetical protein
MRRDLNGCLQKKREKRMGYVEFQSAVDLPATASREADSNAAQLGQDEWSVVEIARNDPLWSLNPDGLLQRLVRTLFGIQPPRPLANERLEAVRRLAVVAWKRGVIGAAAVGGFLAVGYSAADARLIVEYVLLRRKVQSRPRGIA